MKLVCVLCLALVGGALAESPVAAPLKPGEWGTVTFKESVLMADADQLKLRLHAAETPKPYDVSKELYDARVPKGYHKDEPHGLLVWISSSAKVSVPKGWEKVLDDKKVIFIGARNSGNPRDVFDRMRLAIDANHQMRQLYNIAPRRVWISGFSGGSRVASMLGVCYADMFAGTICFMGVNFYEDTTFEKELYQTRYLPDDQLLAIAKRYCHYALVTGSKDFNLNNTTAIFEQGFKKEGFAAARLFNVPEQGHAPPAAEWLVKCIDFMDQPIAPSPKK